MKTIEELYNEVMASVEMKKEFFSLKPEAVEGFAEKNGCKATLEEIKAFITERNHASKALSDDELCQVVGGKDEKVEKEYECMAVPDCKDCSRYPGCPVLAL